jgi:hypothetical protein
VSLRHLLRVAQRSPGQQRGIGFSPLRAPRKARTRQLPRVPPSRMSLPKISVCPNPVEGPPKQADPLRPPPHGPVCSGRLTHCPRQLTGRVVRQAFSSSAPMPPVVLVARCTFHPPPLPCFALRCTLCISLHALHFVARLALRCTPTSPRACFALQCCAMHAMLCNTCNAATSCTDRSRDTRTWCRPRW